MIHRRRPARVSDVTNPNTRHILPMILGKWLIAGTEKRAATDVKRKIIFFSLSIGKVREAPSWRQYEAIGDSGHCNSASSGPSP